jgi:hypothetical protein
VHRFNYNPVGYTQPQQESSKREGDTHTHKKRFQEILQALVRAAAVKTQVFTAREVVVTVAFPGKDR